MPGLDRRQFLVSAAAGLAGTSVASARPSVSRFAGGACERLNVAVMGVHSRGKTLATNFAKLADAEVAVICDVDRRAMEAGIAATAAVQEACAARRGRRPQGAR